MIIMRPDSHELPGGIGADVLELVSPLHLRSAWGLRDLEELEVEVEGDQSGGRVPIPRISLLPVFYPCHNKRQRISNTFLSPVLSIPGLLGFDADPSATATLEFACRSSAQDAERACGHSQTGATGHPEVGPKTPAVAPDVECSRSQTRSSYPHAPCAQ